MESKPPKIYVKETHHEDEFPAEMATQIKPEAGDDGPKFHNETVVVKEELILEDVQPIPEQPETSQENRVILTSGYEITIKNERPDEEDEQDTAVKEEPAPEENSPAKLRCGKCKKLFDLATSYRMHCQRHRNLELKRYVCKPCRKTFGSQRDLTRHEQGMHGMSKNGKLVRVYKCRYKLCDKVCDSEESFKEHLQAHRIVGKKLFRCEKCKQCFSCRKSLSRHVKFKICDTMPRALEEADGTFRCSTCSKAFSQQYLIDQHIRKHLSRHDYRFKTLDLTEQDTAAAGKDPIVVQRNGVECYKCPMCLKLIRKRYSCVQHIRWHVVRARGTFQCETCGLYLGSNKELVQHEVDKHGRVKPEQEGPVEVDKRGLFRCTECTKTFTQRRLALRHIRRHKAMEEGTFQCKICAKCFSENAELMKHSIEKHNEEQKVLKAIPLEQDANGRFKCTHCEQTFALRTQCAGHIRRHKIKESGRFRCKKCLKCFVRPMDLRSHERAATSLTQSLCSKNQKSLKINQEKLAKLADKKHHVVEQNDTFICSSCGKVFLQRRFCVTHIRRHVDIERGRFRCETCGMNLGTNKELRLHAARKHGTIAGVVANPHAPIQIEQDENGWFKCPECPQRFRVRLSCTKHMKRHEHVRSGKYQCGVESCGVRFASNYELKRHVLVHESEEPAKASTSKAPTAANENKSEESIPGAS